MTESRIYAILKVWAGGRYEVLAAYRYETEAREAAASLIPLAANATYSLSLHEIKLYEH